MTDTIGSHELAIVSPQAFAERMELHWTQTLGMCSSQALKALWRTMAETFQLTILDTAKGAKAPWRILQPPTGSGKTQGTCLYSALQADCNRSTKGTSQPVGIVIVTRLIDQAESLVSTINDMASREVACAYHSESETRLEDTQAYDVLVITHQAYVNAAESLSLGNSTRLSGLMAWSGGERLLTIIDEALGNVIESNKVTIETLGQVIGYLTPAIRNDYLSQVTMLELFHRVLFSYASHDERCALPSQKLYVDEAIATDFSMAPLIEAMKELPYDRIVLKQDNDTQRKNISQRVTEILKDFEALFRRYVYYSKRGQEYSFNSSAFLIPDGMPGPVVLDATARQTFLYDLLEDKAVIIPTPSEKARNYSNVTLHVARASGLGKHSMREHFPARFPRLLNALESELGDTRSVFFCVHKHSEHIALTYNPKFARTGVGHWGAVDGRNDWADFDAAVIFGLSYRDTTWSTNAFFATQGVQDDEWLSAPKWKQFDDVRKVMEQRQLSVSIIQAINRIRCRRVIDDQGRSPTADIFIVLPSDSSGDAILQDILADMPRLNVAPWEFEMDGPKVRRVRRNSSHEALVAMMSNRLPGETSMATVKRELGLADLKKLKEALRSSDHPITTTLRDIGVEYVVRGSGRGAKSFLVKREPS